MSSAFTKEQDDDDDPRVDLPDRPISAHRNLVTAEGLAQIERELTRLHAELEAALARDDKHAVARAQRDLRYRTARRASAELIHPIADTSQVRFRASCGRGAQGRQAANLSPRGRRRGRSRKGTHSLCRAARQGASRKERRRQGRSDSRQRENRRNRLTSSTWRVNKLKRRVHEARRFALNETLMRLAQAAFRVAGFEIGFAAVLGSILAIGLDAGAPFFMRRLIELHNSRISCAATPSGLSSPTPRPWRAAS